MLAEGNDAIFFLWSQKNAPAVFGHPDVIELGPAARIDRIGGAQIDQRLLEALRAHVAPPVHVAGMPALKRFEHLAILAEIHVVGNFCAVVDVHDVDVHGRAPCWRRMASSEWRMERTLFAIRHSLFAPHTLVMSNRGFWPLP